MVKRLDFKLKMHHEYNPKSIKNYEIYVLAHYLTSLTLFLHL